MSSLIFFLLFLMLYCVLDILNYPHNIVIELFLIWESFLFLIAILFNITDKLQSWSSGILSSKGEATRRQLLAVGFASPLVSLLTYSCSLTVLPAWAEDQEIQDKDESVVGAIKSLFDPNETTKSGKVLPKAYLNSVREVVKTLRESLKEDPNDMSKFRRTADAAKESIREYLGGWRGQKSVVNEVILFQQTKSGCYCTVAH